MPEDVAQHLPLVDRVAKQLGKRLPSHVEVEDLRQVGVIGLIAACRDFDDGRGCGFKTYAWTRIQGAMLDFLRQQAWVPRGVRQQQRQVQKAEHDLAQRLARPPGLDELADELGLPADRVDAIRAQPAEPRRHAEKVHQLPAPLQEAEAGDPRAEALLPALQGLPEVERLAVSLHFYAGLPQHAVAEVLGVTESRTSQIIQRALGRLEALLRRFR